MKSSSGIATLFFTLVATTLIDVQAQEKPPAQNERAARPLIRVPTALPLEDARASSKRRKRWSKPKTAGLPSQSSTSTVI